MIQEDDIETPWPARVVLVGPSGSGKSELGARLAERLGYAFVDTDAAIVEHIGMPIATFFSRFGEPAFRAIETAVIADVARRPNAVIATGGGAVLAPANWLAWRPGSVVVALSASPETLVARVREQALSQGDLAERPLLAGDALERMRVMLDRRWPLYAQADEVIDTEGRGIDEVEAHVLAAVRCAARAGRVPALSIGTPIERSDIFIGRGVRAQVPELVRRRWPKTRRVWLITDEHVAARWLDSVRADVNDAGLEARTLVVSPGENAKRMENVAALCDAMTTGGATRRDVVLALGGGVIGDLAGFVAAICLRGLSLVQMPTSLLAMVDSSVGGKTGVNNPAGKNMIGAFYQPGIVVVDPDFLTTLPREEYRSGMAEVIKHAVIQPSTPLGGDSLFSALKQAAGLDPLDADRIERVLGLNVAIKHSVVQADERETGLRMILNFGHTAGHAIEADGYRYRHGEAVALGMLVAGYIAVRLGRVERSWMESLAALIARAGLPTRVGGRVDDLLHRMSRDKKAVDGALTWILPARAGGVEIVGGAPIDVVTDALRAVGAK